MVVVAWMDRTGLSPEEEVADSPESIEITTPLNEVARASLPNEVARASLPNDLLQTSLPNDLLQTSLPNESVEALSEDRSSEAKSEEGLPSVSSAAPEPSRPAETYASVVAKVTAPRVFREVNVIVSTSAAAPIKKSTVVIDEWGNKIVPNASWADLADSNENTSEIEV
jgi:hypothetical protein